jgi:microcystin-dependent protein|tara:strand:+ start:315 stop:1025 length:711 start_codon:yes stop_codon:yes gene_type:complete
MSNYEATKYDFDGANLTGIEGTATGTIVPWSAASLPTGFLECNGATVSRSTYSALFAVVGTTYGAGDGSSTFGLPDLQNNVPVGKSNNKALASTGGADTVAVASSGNISTNTNTTTNTNINVTGNVAGSTANASLSTAQLASHNHTPNAQAHGFQLGQQGTTYGNSNPNAVPNAASLPLNNAGSGQGHSHNMSANFSGSGNASSSSSSSSTSNFSGGTANPSVLQPYLTIIYIIKT